MNDGIVELTIIIIMSDVDHDVIVAVVHVIDDGVVAAGVDGVF